MIKKKLSILNSQDLQTGHDYHYKNYAATEISLEDKKL
jgi:hypothetical protein